MQALLLQYRQAGIFAKEAGGILLGHRRGPHLEVIEATAPMTGDIRRRHSFERLDPGHQVRASTRWRVSDSTILYLGEWHTHPCSKPSPSGVDNREWGKLVRTNEGPLIFIIVGTEFWYVEFGKVSWLMHFP